MTAKRLLECLEIAKKINGQLIVQFKGKVFADFREKHGDIELSQCLDLVGNDWEYHSGKLGDSVHRPQFYINDFQKLISFKEAKEMAALKE